jgi:hypothetical protein
MPSDERPDHMGGHIGGVLVGEPAAPPADRRTNRINDVSLSHAT